MSHRRPHILLRSSWQSVNIGDIAHTPGMLALLEKHLPEAQVTLWPQSVDAGVRAMVRAAFPRVAIVDGTCNGDGAWSNPELEAAWQDAHFFLHGSGPSLVGLEAMRRWAQTGRPYGVLGVTLETADAEVVRLLSDAAFFFTRETTSLANARRLGVHCPVMDFGPDATFALTLRNEEAAQSYMAANGLEPGNFVPAIPRLRYTPYYKIKSYPPGPEDLRREAVSDQYAHEDHAKLSQALEDVVRATGVQVLACPEMTYQVPLAKELLVDPQPHDVAGRFVWRDHYWYPDEAASVYARARALVSFEMHSPIIAAGVGVPAIYLRQPTDTCKGQMWRDVGLEDWILEIPDNGWEDVARVLRSLVQEPAAARQKLAMAMEGVAARHAACCAVLRATLGMPECPPA